MSGLWRTQDIGSNELSLLALDCRWAQIEASLNIVRPMFALRN